MSCDNVVFDIANLKNNKFWLVVPDAPKELDWNVTAVTLPGLNSGPTAVKTVNKMDYSVGGDTLSFSPSSITFTVSNNLFNYIYFYKWFLDIITEPDIESFKTIDLLLVSNDRKPTRTGFRLKDSIITDLDGLSFQMGEESPPVSATASLYTRELVLLIDGEEVGLDKYLDNCLNHIFTG